MNPKYKAWDTTRKKMFSAEELGRDQLTLSPDGRGFINVHGKSTRLSEYYSHLLPLQFLGLHDKDGKVIDWWDGDLLKSPDNRIGRIVYSRWCGKWTVIDNLKSTMATVEEARRNNWHKIGNIYENPEEE